ncbi:MAG: DUF6776 family protein [Steroidobacteraceae bacterium]
MVDGAPRVVIRRQTPMRRTVFIAACLLLGLIVLYVAYEFGRFDAGYDRLAAAQRQREQTHLLREMDGQNQQLRAQLAELETYRVGQSRERAELSRTIGELQAQVARQSQDLAFFRGIVAEKANAAEVKIQQFRIASTATAQHFQLRFTLVQPVRPENVVQGGVEIIVEGAQGGRPLKLDLTALGGDAAAELPFSFRYFENFSPEVTLPEGFVPERVTVTVKSRRKGVEPVTQSYLWSVDSL